MSKAVTYVNQQMAACGFAVLSGEIAATLRPDMFSSGADAGYEFSQASQRNAFANLPRAMRMIVKFEEMFRPLVVVTRSQDDLARRIEHVTGLKVLGLTRELPEPAAAAAPSVAPPTRADAQAERLAKLHALAARELPAHDCSERTEIVKARQELERRGESQGVGFVPV
ncbi:hypothetical protein [Ottowia sp. SB7-C50]|uniref:hypothetical protein n=1 Tax=Ottowia sp. SB7-C50 TaxID=3081231 RepID=UPI00295511BA|nr:hypothetical protein [Ottowia sp. SB7-C50]WOP14588.1 hypothetical protein R0D99_12120 [Ottowia sp. SB7-C50]